MEKTRGFVTIATGKEHYYKIALNLLNSYRYFCKNPLPFAIIAEEENEYTKQFDKTIILENPKRNVLDKLELLKNVPFDETIFIDADSLVYSKSESINGYFDKFEGAADVSSFGRNLPLDSKEGYWDINSIGDLKEKIEFIPSLCSGILFLRKGENCLKLFELCQYLLTNAKKYKFYNVFRELIDYGKPDDEYILSLALAIKKYKMVKMESRYFCLFFLRGNKTKCNISKGLLSYKGQNYSNKKDTLLCHFGTALTYGPIYVREVTMLNLMISGHKIRARLYPFWFYLKVKYYKFRTRGKNKKK